MTVSTTARSAGPYAGTGANTRFTFSFKVFEDSDLLVVKTNTSTFLQSTLTLGGDYTVTLNLDQNSTPGGAVDLLAPLAVGYTLTVTSNLTATQDLDLTNLGGFFPDAIEDALDKIVIVLQQLGVVSTGQTLRVPESTGIPALPAAALRANTVPAFDASGNPTVLVPASGSALDVLLQLADAVNATKGPALVAFEGSLTYLSGVGKALARLKRTTRETAQAVTPVDYSFAPAEHIGGDVRRINPITSLGSDYGPYLRKALQAAPDGGVVTLPPETVPFSTQVVLERQVTLRGHGKRSSVLYWEGNTAGAACITTLGLASTDWIVLQDFAIHNNGTALCGIEIKTSRATLRRLFSNSPKAFVSSVIQTDINNTCYRVLLDDCDLLVSDITAVTPYGFIGARGHTITVQNSMFSGFGTACVRFGGYAGGATGTQVVSGTVIGSRLEAGTSAGVPGSGTSIGVDAYEVEGLYIGASNFEMPGDGLVAGAAQRAIKLRTVRGGNIVGNYFNGGGQSLGGIDVADAAAIGVVIEGNYAYNFNATPFVVKSGTGNLTKVVVGYNHIGGGTSKVVDLGWAPTLSFGGGSTGITYDATSTLAEYRREGKFLVLQGRIKLTNKGSSTGVARVNGLPATAVANNIDAIGAAAVSTYSTNKLHSYVQNGSAQIRLLNESGSEITDTAFTNTSEVLFAIAIQVEA